MFFELIDNNIDFIGMRLWTIHPKYLDGKGLVALWRETLLAQKVLQNKTKGYRNHPQLTRFKNTDNPLAAIGKYLDVIYLESLNRGYSFDRSKLILNNFESKIDVTIGQVQYEFVHLKNKLQKRDVKIYQKIKDITEPEINSIFNIVNGDVENWEVINPNN